MTGLRVAHVRAIFTLPEHYPVRTEHPLAYIEWFTPFHRVDTSTGLYVLSRSTRMHHPYGELVPVDRIVRNCHLIPKFGREMDLRWTSANVTDVCKSFYFNAYLDMHTFCMFRANQYGTINT